MDSKGSQLDGWITDRTGTWESREEKGRLSHTATLLLWKIRSLLSRALRASFVSGYTRKWRTDSKMNTISINPLFLQSAVSWLAEASNVSTKSLPHGFCVRVIGYVYRFTDSLLLRLQIADEEQIILPLIG